MNPNEIRRKLKRAGFKHQAHRKTNELFAFRDITVAVPYHEPYSRNTIPEVNQAIRKAELRLEMEPEPLGTLADSFREASKNKEGRRFYRCTYPGCSVSANEVDELNAHIDLLHPKPKPEPVVEIAPKLVAPVHEQKTNQHGVLPPPFRGMGKFKIADRERLLQYVLPRILDNQSLTIIAKEMNQDGITNPNGVPWNGELLSNMQNTMWFSEEIAREKRRRLREQKKLDSQKMVDSMPESVQDPTPEERPWACDKCNYRSNNQESLHNHQKGQHPSLPEKKKLSIPTSIALMVGDAELSISQKVDILKAAKIKIPASIQLILEGDDLDEDQKLRIFETLL